MAKKDNRRVTAINAGTLATFEGVFGAIIGLVIAIIYSLRTTVDIAEQTDSVLQGLVFGLAAGGISIIVVPLIYFGIGWIVGYIHGFIFNVVASGSGGLLLSIEDED